ncbi:MAG TPA: relaxase/mobilization nuclease domain-containing protein [Longimicrobium sp.]
MIGRAHALGRSFRKLVSYLKTGKDGRQQQRDRVDWVEFRNLPTRNPDTAACMMAATAGESVSGTRDPVYHFSVSCDPGDPVDSVSLQRVADRLIRDLELEEYQVLIFAHKDRAHPHLHFVVNRVHPERHTLWRTWKDYPRIERSLRAQEQELGLRIVPGWNSVVVRSEDGGLRVPPEYETGFQRVYPRSGPGRGSADFLREVTARAAPVLEQSRSWAELERGLAEHGLALRAKGGGFTLTDGTRQVKASDVGRGCSRFHLEKRLGSYPDYKARMAVAGIAPALPAPVIQPPVTRPNKSAPTQAQAPARSPEPPAQTPPSATSHTQSTGTVGHGTTRPRPQFGDAGHGIQDLFSDSPSGEPERPGPTMERTPKPQRTGRAFLRAVQERGVPVLEQAGSWAEVERGLADHGLVLREKGGGFVVTDGEREVKASEVGRAFSRFHLEKRLGQYPNSRAQKAVEGIPPVTPAPAVKPDPATRQPEQLTLPLTAPAAQEGRATEAREAPRFTLYDDGTVFGVRDRDGQVFFAETRGRALAEVERANAIAALYPDVMSMRHLREMDGEWRDARGLPRLPEAADRRIVVPAPESSADGLPSLPPSVARVQRDPPIAPDATLLDGAAAEPAERTLMPTRTPESVVQPPRSKPMDRPAPTQPAVRTEEPRTSAQPSTASVTSATDPRDHSATRSPDRITKPPVRKRTRPDSDRERYRIVLRAFKDELAALYVHPGAARRAFDASLAAASPEDAARVLAATPGKFGRLRLVADLRRLPEAGRQAELYARWQTDRTRLYARHVAAAFRRAVAVEEAEAVLRAARSTLGDAAAAPSYLTEREQRADEGERIVERRLREIYDRPARARDQIETYRHANGRAALLRALEKSPERFGPLRTEWKHLLGIPLIPDTTKAQGEASSSVALLSGALKAIAARPSHEEYARASEAIRQAEAKLDAAQKARDALGPATALDSVRDAVKRFDAAGRGSADRTGRLDRQVASMLPSGALPVVRKLMETIVQQQERDRAQEQRRALRPDIA